jgi:hypothetical protein
VEGQAIAGQFLGAVVRPCVQEMPELSALAAGDGGKRFNVIGIGIDSPSNIAEFSEQNKIAYPLYVGGMSGTDLSRELGNSERRPALHGADRRRRPGAQDLPGPPEVRRIARRSGKL